MALSHFLLSLKGLAYFPTVYFVALRQFPLRQAQHVPVSLLKPTLFCKLFVGVDITNKTATSLPLSFCHTFVLFLVRLPFLRLSFSQTLTGTRYPTFSPSFLTGFDGFTVTHFFRALSLPMCVLYDVRCFSRLQSHVVSLSPLVSFLVLEAYCLIKVLRHIGPLSILVLPRHARCVFLVFVATDTAFC